MISPRFGHNRTLESIKRIFGKSTDRDNRGFAAVGFPKVGNTWLRIMLGRFVQQKYGLDDMPLMDTAEVTPLTARGVHAAGAFTHAPLEWTVQTAADLSAENVVKPFVSQKVVLLTRHPLDVLVSLYMHQKFMNLDSPYSGSLIELIDDPVFGLDKFIRFHRIWYENRNSVANFMLWRYEDARANPHKAMEQILLFLGEHTDNLLIDDAVAYASFDNMKKMETSGQAPRYKSSGFQIFATGDAGNPDAHHVRQGKVGGWREQIPATEHARLEAKIISELPNFLGYNS